MTPPIEGITITSENVKNLTDEEMDIVVVEKQQRLSANLGETKEITKEYLLNKPNMTIKDKEGMQKAIDYLVEHTMDTSENFEKLDAIVYTSEYIKIGGIKRAREDLSAQPNNVDIFQHNNITCFKRNKDTIQKQNDLLAQQDMEIATDNFFTKSMKALPGNYSRNNRYEGGNILALITNMSDYYHNKRGDLVRGGYRWVVDGLLEDHPRVFEFIDDKGSIFWTNGDSAIPIRPVFK